MTRLFVLIAILTLALTGCNSAKTHPVNGTVKFKDGADGSALVGYTVDFESVEQKVSGSGVVKADGKFAISTYADEDGAVPGKHRVSVSPPEPLPDAVPPKPLIGSKYFSPETSGLEVEIKAGPNDVSLELERSGR